MESKDILEQLTEIFRDVFDDESLLITNETDAEDIDDWDSLEQINLLLAIEKKYDIKFNIEEVTGLQNVGDMVTLVMRKVNHESI